MRGKLRFGLVLAILLGGVALVTAPGQGAGELKLRAALERELARADPDSAGGPLGQGALAACRLDPESCYSLVRARIETHYEHRMVYSVFTVEGFGKTATCYGAFTRYVCPGGVVDIGG